MLWFGICRNYHIPCFVANSEPRTSLRFSFMIPKWENNWLVVWNIFYFSIQWECHHPNWLSLHHFSEGLVETTRAGWAQMFIMEYHLSCQTYPICSLLLFKKGGSAATTRKASLPGSPESLRPVHSSGVPTCFGFKVGSEWKLLRDINGLFWDGIRWFSGSRS